MSRAHTNPELTPPELEAPETRCEKRKRKKRNAEGTVELVQRATALRPEELDGLPLDERIVDQIRQLQGMKSDSARKRLLRYVARQIRNDDNSALEAFLGEGRAAHRAGVEAEHALERLRAELLSGGDAALDELCTAHPQADRQRLRQLVRQANKEKATGRPPRASRSLFRILREIVG